MNEIELQNGQKVRIRGKLYVLHASLGRKPDLRRIYELRKN